MLLKKSWKSIIKMTMEGLLVGNGWHQVEMKDGNYIRWSGPENRSTIHINPRRDIENRMNITIHSVMDKEIIKGLKIEADSIPLNINTSYKSNPIFITTILPKDVSKTKGENTIISFLLPNTIYSESDKKPNDEKRLCGIALQQIDIFPLKRSLFVAQKYSESIPFDGIQYIKYHPEIRDGIIHSLYNSAYDFFIKNNRVNPEAAFSSSHDFDECPGDIFDILKTEMHEICNEIEEKYSEEIKILRNTIYRQGDEILKLKKIIKGRE